MSLDLFKGVDPSAVALAAAGAAGGVYRWYLLRQKKGEGLLAGALSLAGAVSMGVVASLTFGPLMTPIVPAAIHVVWFLSEVTITDAQAAPAGGFIAGLLGLGIAGFLIDFFSELRRVLIEKARGEGRS